MDGIKTTCCGKFRKSNEVYSYDHTDYSEGETESEIETSCIYCCSESDYNTYFKKEHGPRDYNDLISEQGGMPWNMND